MLARGVRSAIGWERILRNTSCALGRTDSAISSDIVSEYSRECKARWGCGGDVPRATSSSSRVSQIDRDMEAPVDNHALLLKEYGKPEDVLWMEKQAKPGIEMLGDDQVLIRILAAPVNPSDISLIEGRYPLRASSLPCTPGFEGVGVVEAVGKNVTRLRPGDRAVPIEHGQGTWRTYGVFEQNHWYRIPHDIPISTAATMCINPPTALRLLEEFVDLNQGDVIIHTGGTSSTGKYILQLAKQRGIRCISVIRDRPERKETEHELKELGSSLVVTAEELGTAMKEWPYGKPRLGLDCIGGDDSLQVAKVLDANATLVVYGGMSRQPIQIPPGSFIFNNITVKGFWLTGGFAQMKQGWKAKEILVDRVIALFRQKVIKPVTVDCLPFDQWKQGIEMYRKSNTTKVLLTHYTDDVCM
jgi:mitochondrial enoyl-[acyl-carrier protein] reductase / trans-2-enoyl-CoA reductase